MDAVLPHVRKRHSRADTGVRSALVRQPAIVEAMGALPAASQTIDGEAVVCDLQGVTDFDALRSALGGLRRAIDRRLRSIEVLPDADATLLLGIGKGKDLDQLDGTDEFVTGISSPSFAATA